MDRTNREGDHEALMDKYNPYLFQAVYSVLRSTKDFDHTKNGKSHCFELTK